MSGNFMIGFISKQLQGKETMIISRKSRLLLLLRKKCSLFVYKCTLLSFLICCRTMNQSKLVQRNMLVRYVGLSEVLRQKFAGTILYILVKSHLLAHIVTLPLIREAIVIAIWESIMARITQICNFNPNCQINSPHLNLEFFKYLAWLR